MMGFTMNRFTRRSFIAGLAAVGVVSLLPAQAFALSDAQAKGLIDSAVKDINAIISSGKSEPAMYREFEKVFKRYADVPTISRSALGPPARSASSAQLSAFADAFTSYLARKYGKQFREFIGGSVEVTGAKTVKSFVEVKAIAQLRGSGPFVVSFMVSDRSGSGKFFDLLIEGVSLLKSERTEIGSMLDRRKGDINALIRDLKTAG